MVPELPVLLRPRPCSYGEATAVVVGVLAAEERDPSVGVDLFLMTERLVFRVSFRSSSNRQRRNPVL